MAKSEKQAPAEDETAKKPKSKKLLLTLIVLLVLGIAAGAGWYFLKGNHSAVDAQEKDKTVLMDQPKFIALEPFTVNLQREEGDQFLQVGISLKIYDPKLEDEIKTNLPEIRSKLLLLLSSKHASELRPVEGKKKLADEIITEVDGVLGIKRPVPKAPSPVMQAASAVAAASGIAADEGVAADGELPLEDAPVEEEAPVDEEAAREGIVDVLFTAFIIQ